MANSQLIVPGKSRYEKTNSGRDNFRLSLYMMFMELVERPDEQPPHELHCDVGENNDSSIRIVKRRRGWFLRLLLPRLFPKSIGLAHVVRGGQSARPRMQR